MLRRAKSPANEIAFKSLLPRPHRAKQVPWELGVGVWELTISSTSVSIELGLRIEPNSGRTSPRRGADVTDSDAAEPNRSCLRLRAPLRVPGKRSHLIRSLRSEPRRGMRLDDICQAHRCAWGYQASVDHTDRTRSEESMRPLSGFPPRRNAPHCALRRRHDRCGSAAKHYSY